MSGMAFAFRQVARVFWALGLFGYTTAGWRVVTQLLTSGDESLAAITATAFAFALISLGHRVIRGYWWFE